MTRRCKLLKSTLWSFFTTRKKFNNWLYHTDKCLFKFCVIKLLFLDIM